jgi:(S)-ureidoglycine aminohydrolase
MRAVHETLHSRTRVRPRYALMPMEGFPTSRIPQWDGAEVRVLASPALGAKFAQYKIDLQSGGGTKHSADNVVESFIYVLRGSINLKIDQNSSALFDGGFAFIPRATGYSLEAKDPTSLMLLRKTFEAAPGVATPKPFVGNQSQIKPEPSMGNEKARLQLLIPDDLQYDMAMNIFSFDPGHCLPYVETHVMEHGLYFLAGKGVYFLDEEWMEVQKDDFIWMGPYCPQSFYATGNEPAKYLYYKNVNREIAL